MSPHMDGDVPLFDYDVTSPSESSAMSTVSSSPDSPSIRYMQEKESEVHTVDLDLLIYLLLDCFDYVLKEKEEMPTELCVASCSLCIEIAEFYLSAGTAKLITLSLRSICMILHSSDKELSLHDTFQEVYTFVIGLIHASTVENCGIDNENLSMAMGLILLLTEMDTQYYLELLPRLTF